MLELRLLLYFKDGNKIKTSTYILRRLLYNLNRRQELLICYWVETSKNGTSISGDSCTSGYKNKTKSHPCWTLGWSDLTLFRNFWNWAHCCWSNIFLWIKFQNISANLLLHTCGVHARIARKAKILIFKITGTLKI